MANYAFTVQRPMPEVQPGTVFESSNFTQLLPHTKIFDGVSGLVFKNCNLINCDVPADAVVESCLIGHVEFCSNVHPEFVKKGLTECPENCAHVMDTDEIWIDGVLIDTVYYYEDGRVE